MFVNSISANVRKKFTDHSDLGVAFFLASAQHTV